MSVADDQRLDDALARNLLHDVHLTARLALARDIRRNPEKHLSALADAGVIERWPNIDDSPPFLYRLVVPQHDHMWRATSIDIYEGADGDEELIYLSCIYGGCRERRTVPNRLPIEVPE